jgi:tRNA threonylcarbamoyladenosine biosynthesis protein TsaB
MIVPHAAAPACAGILALDCATEACSVAYWRIGLIAHRLAVIGRGHAERLIPMVEAVMTEAGTNYEQLGAIAVTLGPGSFTGVRVGLASAKGLALASGAPLIGIGTLEVIAAGTDPAERGAGTVFAVLDARNDEVYLQAFDAALNARGEPAILTLSAARAALLRAGPTLLAGGGAALLASGLRSAGQAIRLASTAPYPDAAHLAARAANRLAAGHGTAVPSASPLSPLYLRGSGARLPAEAEPER